MPSQSDARFINPRLMNPQDVPSRAAVLSSFCRPLCRALDISPPAAVDDPGSVDAKAPHPLLLRMLRSDPAMAAMLPTIERRIALGLAEHAPFLVTRSGLLMLPPGLLANSGALAAAARWGLEAGSLLASAAALGSALTAGLLAALRHGWGLLRQLGADDRALLLALLPKDVADALAEDREPRITPELLRWQAERVEAVGGLFDIAACSELPPSGGELALPLERILVAGGDSRLVIDPVTGLNRYGTVPRPRPEAVHFSSSTASSISDYGFMLGETFRRALLGRALHDIVAPVELRCRMADAIGAELSAIIGIDPGMADLILAPSGSDTEMLAVMLALAAADRPLTNILIAPEETGRAVALAGAGRYFDDLAGSGAPVRKGEEAWPGRAIAVEQVAIRAVDGRPRAAAEINAELVGLVRTALGCGRRVLLHVLPCSKTGLSAPSVEHAADLVRMAPELIDVVVDACQMRTPFDEIIRWTRLGWMTQLSGSKFWTGPPFSGALALPLRYRERADEVRDLLSAAPGVGRPEDWNAWWRQRLAPNALPEPPSFGLLLRWIPALAEAHLLGKLPTELCGDAFRRFRARLGSRITRSRYLAVIEPSDALCDEAESAPINLGAQSIVCFSVAVRDGPGHVRTLDARECQKLFQLLNLDISRHLDPLTPMERVTASQCAHIGQPVALNVGNNRREIGVLRMVIGARFFSIVGYAGPEAIEAALESEISDAVRAIDKLELLAARWRQLADLGAE